MEYPVGVSKFNYQVIVATNSLFLVLITTENSKEIAACEKHESSWKFSSKRHKFSKDVMVQLGEKFVAFVEPKGKKIETFKWNHNDDEANLLMESLEGPNNLPLIRTLSQGRMIIAYDDLNLFVFYINKNSDWQVKTIKQISGYESTTHRTIDTFGAEEELTKQLKHSLTANLLQLDRNQIVLTKLQELRGTISVVAHMMTLDARYNIAQERIEVIDRENFYGFSYTVTSENTKFILKYEKVDSKFAIRIKDIILEEDARNQIPPTEKLQLLEELNNSVNWRNYFKKIFMLDWKKYHARLTSAGLLCGDDITFRMTGS